MIQEIEGALLERIGELATPFGVRVELYPDGPDGYSMTHPVGAVLVVNKASRYDAPKTTDRHIQRRALTYEIAVLVRALRDAKGVYPLIDALAAGLAGWKHQYSASGTRLVEERFSDHEASVWVWVMVVETDAYLVPAPKVEPERVLTSVTGRTNMGESTTIGGKA